MNTGVLITIVILILILIISSIVFVYYYSNIQELTISKYINDRYSAPGKYGACGPGAVYYNNGFMKVDGNKFRIFVAEFDIIKKTNDLLTLSSDGNISYIKLIKDDLYIKTPGKDFEKLPTIEICN